MGNRPPEQAAGLVTTGIPPGGVVNHVDLAQAVFAKAANLVRQLGFQADATHLELAYRVHGILVPAGKGERTATGLAAHKLNSAETPGISSLWRHLLVATGTYVCDNRNLHGNWYGPDRDLRALSVPRDRGGGKHLHPPRRIEKAEFSLEGYQQSTIRTCSKCS